jgi:hypothetical protein
VRQRTAPVFAETLPHRAFSGVAGMPLESS